MSEVYHLWSPKVKIDSNKGNVLEWSPVAFVLGRRYTTAIIMKKKKRWNGKDAKKDGAKGGENTFKKYGVKYMTKIGKRGQKKSSKSK